MSFSGDANEILEANERAGIAAALVFLDMNGVEITATNDALYDAVLAVAKGDLQKSGIAEFLRKHSRV